MDYNVVCLHLIRFLRGQQSQKALNIKLGFKSNQVYRWESGQSQISWSQFCDLCRVRRAPLSRALTCALNAHLKSMEAREIVIFCLAHESQASFARQIKVSVPTLSRWVKGALIPNLGQILKVLDTIPGALMTFISVITAQKGLKILAESHALHEREMRVHAQFPYTGAVLLCLRMPEYVSQKKHVAGIIAGKIGISMEQEREVLRALLEAGAITLRDGLYVQRQNQINLAGDRAQWVALRTYWMQRTLELMRENPTMRGIDKLIWPYMVFNCSERDYARIQRKVSALFKEINQITVASDDGNQIYLLNLQLLSLTQLQAR